MATKKGTGVDYEALGKAIYSLQDINADKKKLYTTAFLKGMASGLGGVIGATVIVGIMLWSLSFFDEIPLIGKFTRTVQDTVQQAK
jgi:hypothetical protein